jgi:thiamine-phosphate pyrophosphorylase
VKRCWITNRALFASIDELLDCAARVGCAGVEMIQVREKDLAARDLYDLVRRFLAVCPRTRIIVNSRLDVALAAGAHGVHLPGCSPAPAALRAICPPGFLIGVSCHSIEELKAAEREGADYAMLAPVFKPISKSQALPPLGLDVLRRGCASVSIPVHALGGITAANAGACIEAGAAGVAGISLFSQGEQIRTAGEASSPGPPDFPAASDAFDSGL